MKALCTAMTLSALFALAPLVRAGQPTDEVKATADRIIGIMNDASLEGDAKKVERRHLIRLELDKRFDWPYIARSCLGRHWAKRSPVEQQEFVKLFVDFLEDTYMEKFETYYGDFDKIDYHGEKIASAGTMLYASVRTTLTTKAKVDHPVEYRLHKAQGANAWQVYDVVIEGVSMVRNYREQFDEILARSSYDKLIADLKSRSISEPKVSKSSGSRSP